MIAAKSELQRAESPTVVGLAALVVVADFPAKPVVYFGLTGLREVPIHYHL